MSPTLGEIAYNAYCEAVGWVSFKGDPLPHFNQMRTENPKIASAWEKAGDAVARQISIETGRG